MSFNCIYYGSQSHRYYRTRLYDKFEDAKGVMKNRRRTDNTMVNRKRTKGKKRSTKHIHRTKDKEAPCICFLADCL